MAIILVVDDNHMDREIMKTILSKVPGAQVIEAEDGEAAHRMIFNGQIPDVIVTDIHMPKLGGIELLKLLKNSSPPYNVIPIVVVSGILNNGLPEYRALLRAQGAADFVDKADFNKELARAVKQVLGLALVA